MRAVVQSAYGPPHAVLSVAEVDRPSVADDEVLVRVRAASVHADVWHVIVGKPYVLRLMGSGLVRPRRRIPGTDVSGVVEVVGSHVTTLAKGDAVFGETVRGIQWRNGGAYAEFVAVPADALVRKPPDVSFEVAAAVPTSGLIALDNLPSSVGAGTRVLVNGGAGAVGSMVMQTAVSRGAVVTGVDTTSKLDTMRRMGADAVIDYTVEDFTMGDERFDVIVDIPGNHAFSKLRRVMTDDGVYVYIGHDQYGATRKSWLGAIPRFVGLLLRSPFVDQLPGPDFSTIDKTDGLTTLAELLASGSLAVEIERTYPLSETADAITHLASGATTGRLVISVEQETD